MVFWIPFEADIFLGTMEHLQGGADLMDEAAALVDEAAALVDEGVTTVVSLLTLEEVDVLGLSQEEKILGQSGIQFLHYSIEDRSVPPSVADFLKICASICEQLLAGERVAIHCRYGIGRSSLMAACIMLCLGEDPDSIFERISEVRGQAVPDTVEQKEFFENFKNFLKE